jgi:hypothetical protein
VRPDFDDDESWAPRDIIPWWMSAVGAGIIFIALGGIAALCITG